jgi:hypothetical protein
MKEYRIVKRHTLRGEFNDERGEHFAIEYLGYRLSFIPPFFCKDWKTLRETICVHMDCFESDVTFKTVEECERYIKGLKNQPYSKEVIKHL